MSARRAECPIRGARCARELEVVITKDPGLLRDKTRSSRIPLPGPEVTERVVAYRWNLDEISLDQESRFHFQPRILIALRCFAAPDCC